MTASRVYEPVSPSRDEIKIAQESSRTLSRFLKRNLRVQIAETKEIVELPVSAVRLLVDLLTNMAEGNAVTLMPIHAELTTQQAADLIGISRPYLIKLLEDGKIAYHMVGTHRRIFFQDLKNYMDKNKQARDLDMGY
jgi:excisionase family DNA binding protein